MGHTAPEGRARRGNGYPRTPMVKIYTRKGDDGTTSLWYGGRVSKTDLRTEAYGTLDEAASVLGVARSACDDQDLAAAILQLQNELFVAGAELATAPVARDRLEDGVSRISADMVTRLEREIDAYMSQVELPPKFVIPGGTRLSAQLDVARAVLRRAERRIVALAEHEGLKGSALLGYVNRANDLLFAMARFADEPQPELFEGRGKDAGS
jgi:cob(I)alamin adenosyltransferase